MRNDYLKRFCIFIISSLMVIAIICAGTNVEEFKAVASSSSIATFGGIEGSPNGEALYNATNTYDYNGDNVLNNRAYVYYDTSTEGKNNNYVSDDTPLITVLTHGLGGEAAHWSNAGDDFVYDEESLFARLQTELLKNGGNGANVYWAVMQNSTAFRLYDLNDEDNRTARNVGTDSEYIEFTKSQTTNAITDISKHIILIFESSVKNEYNYKVYEEFNYMLSKIIYDVKLLSGGELPRINLIGHSRGGITNLQYALDHPDIVDSMFSLGTPYFGSDTASVSLAESIAPGNGRLDIIDRNIFMGYYNRWHNDYNRLYSNIEAHALGGYSDSDFLFDALIASDLNMIEDKVSDELLGAIKEVIRTSPDIVTTFKTIANITDFVLSLSGDENYNESELQNYIQILADIQYFAYDDSEGFWENLGDIIIHNLPFVGCPYFMNDLLVDLPSQIGLDTHSDTFHTYGFYTYAKCYENSDYADGTVKKLSSSTMPAIVHNLEARDKDMIDYILSNISLGGYEGYIYNKTSETTATLVGYRGNLVSNEIVLPTQIDGLTVNCIGSDLFKGKGNNITSITIPDTVVSIDNYAFAGLRSLVTVGISENSSLESVGFKAFSGCSELVSYNITKNVNNIKPDAFLNCSKLEEFSVSELNSVYSAIDGVLYNKEGTILLHYPEGKEIGVFELPLSVTAIEAYAFSDNVKIEQLHIYGTPTLGNFAFYNCANLNEVYFYSYNVPEIGIGAFLNNEFTLYVPHNTQNTYNAEFEGYTSNISSIPITITFMVDNEECATLETYYGANIVGLIDPFKEGYVFNYWSDDEGNIYQNNGVWDSTIDLTVEANWTARQSYVNFVGFGTDGIDSILATYDEPIGTLPTPNVDGPTFIGWKDDNGTYYYADTIWNRTNNLTLIADYDGEEQGNIILYYVDLDQDGGVGGSDNVRAEYLAPMPMATAPTREGYTFKGYYTKKNGGGDKYYNEDMSSARNWDIASDRTLYAYWEGLKFTVTLNKDNGTGETDIIEVTYDSVMPTVGLEAPTKTGYTFRGYYDDDGKQYYVGPNLSSDVVWKKLADTTLHAHWEETKYTISFILYDELTNGNTVSVSYGDYITVNYAPYRNHYEFKGYYSKANGEGTCYIRGVLEESNGIFRIVPESTDNTWNQYSDGVLYAHWERLEAEIGCDVYVFGEGTTLAPRTVSIVSGEQTTLSAPTIDGYIFDHWAINSVDYATASVTITLELHRSYVTGEITLYKQNTTGSATYSDGYIAIWYTKDPNACVAEGTMITLADGSQVPVESLTGNEMLLVWNLHTGSFDIAPILFIDHDIATTYRIVNLSFSDGTQVKVIDEHAFWDFNLNKYVFLREDAIQYVGHWFNKQTIDESGNLIWTRVQLTNVTITEEYTTAWSPVTYGHLCIYVNGMLSMPGATEGLINIFEVDGDTMRINQEQYLIDIATYGLFTYDEFAEIYPIPETIFEAFGGEYLKVSIGKGLIDYETLGDLIGRYSKFFE